MNGKPRSEPNNHVEWANKFKSNMPDWPTARRCAVTDDMLFMLKECRTVMLAVDSRPGEKWPEYMDKSRFDAILDRVQQVITLAEFGPPDQTLGQPDGMTDTRNESVAMVKTKMMLPPLPPPPGAKK